MTWDYGVAAIAYLLLGGLIAAGIAKAVRQDKPRPGREPRSAHRRVERRGGKLAA